MGGLGNKHLAVWGLSWVVSGVLQGILGQERRVFWPRARASSRTATASGDVSSSVANSRPVQSCTHLPGMGGSASKASFDLATSESRQREPTSEQGPCTLVLSLWSPTRSCLVRWCLGSCHWATCGGVSTRARFWLAVLQKDNMSFACSTKIFCKPHHAFSSCCRPVAAAKSQLNHHRPPNLDPKKPS